VAFEGLARDFAGYFFVIGNEDHARAAPCRDRTILLLAGIIGRVQPRLRR
jgi:hypothetical protein